MCLDMWRIQTAKTQYTRRDLNPQPSVPKTDALSNCATGASAVMILRFKCEFICSAAFCQSMSSSFIVSGFSYVTRIFAAVIKAGADKLKTAIPHTGPAAIIAKIAEKGMMVMIPMRTRLWIAGISG